MRLRTVAASRAAEHANPAASRDRRAVRKNGAAVPGNIPADGIVRTGVRATLSRVPTVLGDNLRVAGWVKLRRTSLSCCRVVQRRDFCISWMLIARSVTKIVPRNRAWYLFRIA